MNERVYPKIVLSPPINPTLVTDGAGLEKLKKFFDTLKTPIIGWDKETGFSKDFFYRKDRTWQFGNVHEQYVIDLLAFVDGDSEALYHSQGYYGIKMDKRLQPVLDVVNPVICDNKILKVGVNLGFEYEQSYWNFGQRTWHLYSCDMIDRVIWAGAHSLKDYDFFSMEELTKRYFGVQIDKSLQKTFDLETPLTQDHIDYAALDTRIPLGLRLKQLPILRKDGLEEVCQIENNAIGAFIDMHVHGQRINREQWAGRNERLKKELIEAVAELDKDFVPLVGSKHDVISDEEIEQMKAAWKAKTSASDLELVLRKEARFCKDPVQKAKLLAQSAALETQRKEEKENLKQICSENSKKRTKLKALVDKAEGEALIDYGSPAQVFAVLKTIKGLGDLDDTNDDTLEKYKKIPVIKKLQKYRELSKQVNTYGEQWTKEWTTHPCAEEGWLHPGDGRLHSKFNQLDAETGRSTSEQPNGQNLPQAKEIRSCFICDPPDETVRITRCCQEEALHSFEASGIIMGKCPKCNEIVVTDPEEYCIVTADMSGAELRIIAELADAKSWIEAFGRDEDVHSVGTELLYPEKWPSLTVASLLHPDKWTLKDVKTELVPLNDKDGKPVLDKDGKQKMVPPCAYFACKDNGEHARQKCDCPEHKKLRDGNKSTNFLLAYGGTAHTLAERIGVEFEEAEKLMALHEKTFPDIWAYLAKSGKQARFTLEARSMFGRRRKFGVALVDAEGNPVKDEFGNQVYGKPDWSTAKYKVIEEAHGKIGNRWERCMRKDFGKGAKFKEVQKKLSEQFEVQNGRKPNKEELWNLTHNPNPLPKNISSMMAGMFERIERQGKNHCIQSTNADIAKLAMGCGYDTKEGKPFLWHTLPKYKARLLAFVHDELIVQCPKRFGEIVAALIGDAFRRAAAEKMVKVIMKFDYHVAPYWQK